MSVRGCVRGKHRFDHEPQTLVCRRCGLRVRVRDGEGGVWLREPAGARDLVTGHFVFDEHADARRLWDQYRLARAYRVADPDELMEFRVPHWFRRLHLSGGSP